MNGVIMMVIAIVVLGGGYLSMEDILRRNGELTRMQRLLLMNWKTA